MDLQQDPRARARKRPAEEASCDRLRRAAAGVRTCAWWPAAVAAWRRRAARGGGGGDPEEQRAPAWRPAIDALRTRGRRPHLHRVRPARRPRATADARRRHPQGPAGDRGGHGAAGRAARPRRRCPTRPLVFCMVPDPASSAWLPAPASTASAFAIPVKNQLAAFRLVNPRGVRMGVIYSERERGRARARRRSKARRPRCASRWSRGGGLRAGRARPRCARCSPATRRSTRSGSRPTRCSWRTRRGASCCAETLKAGKPVYASAGSAGGGGRPGEQRARPRLDRRAGRRAREPAGRGREGRGSSCWCRGPSWSSTRRSPAG